jgi:hypothetical protein
MYKLFAFKQKLLSDKRDKEGCKWHVVLHFPFLIKWLGPAILFDMVRSERSHGVVKHLFDATSKRFGTTEEEIMERTVVVKALKGSLLPEANDNEAFKSINRKIKEDVFYLTDDNIYFSTTTGPQSREKIKFSKGRFIFPDSFINPILDEDSFHETITNYLNYINDANLEIMGFDFLH